MVQKMFELRQPRQCTISASRALTGTQASGTTAGTTAQQSGLTLLVLLAMLTLWLLPAQTTFAGHGESTQWLLAQATTTSSTTESANDSASTGASNATATDPALTQASNRSMVEWFEQQSWMPAQLLPFLADLDNNQLINYSLLLVPVILVLIVLGRLAFGRNDRWSEYHAPAPASNMAHDDSAEFIAGLDEIDHGSAHSASADVAPRRVPQPADDQVAAHAAHQEEWPADVDPVYAQEHSQAAPVHDEFHGNEQQQAYRADEYQGQDFPEDMHELDSTVALENPGYAHAKVPATNDMHYQEEPQTQLPEPAYSAEPPYHDQPEYADAQMEQHEFAHEETPDSMDNTVALPGEIYHADEVIESAEYEPVEPVAAGITADYVQAHDAHPESMHADATMALTPDTEQPAITAPAHPHAEAASDEHTAIAGPGFNDIAATPKAVEEVAHGNQQAQDIQAAAMAQLETLAPQADTTLDATPETASSTQAESIFGDWLLRQNVDDRLRYSIEFLLYWVAYGDGNFDYDTRQRVLAMDNPDSHDLVKKHVFLQDTKALKQTLQYIGQHVSATQKLQVLNLLMAVLVKGDAITAVQNVFFRFYADFIGLGADALGHLYERAFGQPLPPMPRPDNPRWWDKYPPPAATPADATDEELMRHALGLHPNPSSGDILRAYENASMRFNPALFNELGEREQALVARQFKRLGSARDYLLETI